MARIASPTEYIAEETHAIGNPQPLGLLSLAFTTALVGASFAHFLLRVSPAAVDYLGSVEHIGIGLLVGSAIFYGGIVQVLAGMWEFRRNHTLAATIFSAYGGFLIALGALFLPAFGLHTLFGRDIPAFNHAMGLFLFCWAISSGILLVAALRSNMVLLLTLACLFLAYLLLAIGEFANGNGALLAIGGWLAIIAALIAWYAALAGILRSTHSAFQLPMGETAPLPATPAGRYGEPAL
jgi:uncharacterized protein